MNGLNMPDYYQLLGLNYDADYHDIIGAYQSICEKFSIFLYSSRDEILIKNKELVIYKDAYDILSDQSKKNEYDILLKEVINERAVLLQNMHTRIISDTSDLGEDIFQENTIKIELSKVKDDILNENFTKGKNYLNDGLYHEAINLFRKLINMKPSESKFHSYLALALEKKGWLAYAEEEFKISIELNPEDEIAKKHFDNKKNNIISKETSLLKSSEIIDLDYKKTFINKIRKFFKKIIIE
jgi:tetratricopeptide (TPR) repeat protein